jgi:hypothetical protein
MQRLSVVLFALLAACELQPAPKQQAAPPAPTPPPPVIEAPADAGVANDAPAAPRWTEQCRAVGIHIAAVIINSATDPGAKSIYEQDREKMVRSTAETCTAQGWSDAAATCYLKSGNAADLKACEKKFTPPRPRPRPTEPQTGEGSAAGSGSAAPPRLRAGSAVAPRPRAGAATPRPAAGSAAPRAGAGSAVAPRAGAGSAAPRPTGAGSGSARRP